MKPNEVIEVLKEILEQWKPSPIAGVGEALTQAIKAVEENEEWEQRYKQIIQCPSKMQLGREYFLENLKLKKQLDEAETIPLNTKFWKEYKEMKRRAGHSLLQLDKMNKETK